MDTNVGRPVLKSEVDNMGTRKTALYEIEHLIGLRAVLCGHAVVKFFFIFYSQRRIPEGSRRVRFHICSQQVLSRFGTTFGTLQIGKSQKTGTIEFQLLVIGYV